MTIDSEMMDMPTQRVAVDFKMDAGACRRRIGLIALTTDEATERDFHNMLPDPDEIMFYTSRVAPKNPVPSPYDRSAESRPRLALSPTGRPRSENHYVPAV